MPLRKITIKEYSAFKSTQLLSHTEFTAVGSLRSLGGCLMLEISSHTSHGCVHIENTHSLWHLVGSFSFQVFSKSLSRF